MCQTPSRVYPGNFLLYVLRRENDCLSFFTTFLRTISLASREKTLREIPAREQPRRLREIAMGIQLRRSRNHARGEYSVPAGIFFLYTMRQNFDGPSRNWSGSDFCCGQRHMVRSMAKSGKTARDKYVSLNVADILSLSNSTNHIYIISQVNHVSVLNRLA